MSIYGYNIEAVGTSIENGLNKIAKAIEKLATKPTYNVIVNVGGNDLEAVGEAVGAAVSRLENRTKK